MSGSRKRRFFRNEQGAVLAEALIAFPVLTVLSFGLLEFGNLMWQRQQLQSGVRDAARYWSKCRPATVNYAATCNETTARNIAFYGDPRGAGYGQLRVPGWDNSSEITFTPDKTGLESFPQAALEKDDDGCVPSDFSAAEGAPLAFVESLTSTNPQTAQ